MRSMGVGWLSRIANRQDSVIQAFKSPSRRKRVRNVSVESRRRMAPNRASQWKRLGASNLPWVYITGQRYSVIPSSSKVFRH